MAHLRLTVACALLLGGVTQAASAQPSAEPKRARVFVPKGENPWDACRFLGVKPSDRYACSMSVRDLQLSPLAPTRVPANSYVYVDVPDYIEVSSDPERMRALEIEANRAHQLNLDVIDLKTKLSVANQKLNEYGPFVDGLVKSGWAAHTATGIIFRPPTFSERPIVSGDSQVNPRSSNGERSFASSGDSEDSQALLKKAVARAETAEDDLLAEQALSRLGLLYFVLTTAVFFVVIATKPLRQKKGVHA